MVPQDFTLQTESVKSLYRMPYYIAYRKPDQSLRRVKVKKTKKYQS